MRYLPQEIAHGFWGDVEKETLKLMKQAAVLESRAGTLHMPRELELLSNVAQDRFNEPLVGNNSEYLSTRYDQKDYAILHLLEVNVFSEWRFLDRLCSLLDNQIISKPRSWHEDLAKSITIVYRTKAWHEYLSRIKSRKFIPLQNGDWVSSASLGRSPVYFREGAGLISIPSDINLRLVPSHASSNQERRTFFQLLGVKDCNEREVADLIIQTHQSHTAPPITDAVIHAEYIYKLPSAIRDRLDMSRFWLYDE
jgi:hypothetical protein